MEKNVLLIDMYGVIIQESKGNFIPYTLSHFPEAEHQRLLGAFRQEQLFTRAGNGEMGAEEFLKKLGYADPVGAMKDYLENWLTLDAGFIPFAKGQKDFDLVLLSNDVAEWNRYLMEFHGLDQFFEDVIVSGQVHMRKPREEMFRYTLERLGRPARECVFVDNCADNLRAAKRLGIRTVHFNRDGEPYEGCQVKNFQELARTLAGKR